MRPWPSAIRSIWRNAPNAGTTSGSGWPNMPGIARAATAVVIGYIAGGTRTIRVGSGGVMLPNHAPLVIAEQFGTRCGPTPGRGTARATVALLQRSEVAGRRQSPR